MSSDLASGRCQLSLIFYVPFSYTLNSATRAVSPVHKNSQCIEFSDMLKNMGEERINGVHIN